MEHFIPKSVELSKELLDLLQKTKQDVDLQSYIDSFPFQDYKIFDLDGINYFIDQPPDLIKEHLRKGIPWESDIANFLKVFAEKGTIAIDLGAHIGIHTLTMSKAVGPEGRVLAFEPQKKIFRELTYNVKENHALHNTILFNNAVGESERWVEMTPSSPHNEGSTAIGAGGERAYMITLDSLNLSNVSLIKIDVEAYELNVLKGARETILKNQPVIIVEILCSDHQHFTHDEINAQLIERAVFFKSIGYQLRKISHNNDFIAFPLSEDHNECVA